MGNQSAIGFNGVSLLDPSSLVPTFGDWGGPGWSAGHRVDSSMHLMTGEKWGQTRFMRDFFGRPLGSGWARR